MLKVSSKTVNTVAISINSSVKSNSHYSVRSAVAQARSNSDGRYHSKRNLKAKAIMFQNGQMSRREFIGEVSGLIMRAARAMNCRSYDWRYDYYLYVVSDIDKLISCYKPDDNFEFETWFVAICKKRYISFIRHKKSRWCSVSDANLTEIFNNSSEICIDSPLPSYSYEMLDYSGLTSLEQEIIKARYGIMDDAATNISAGLIQNAREEEKLKIADLIAKKYAKLLDIRTKIQNADEEESAELRSKEQRIIRRKRTLENRYNGIKTQNSLSVLCKMYNISRYAIEKALQSAENKLYQNNYYMHRMYEA